MQSSGTQPALNLFGSILRGLLRIQIPSFPNAPIGNPEKALKHSIDDRYEKAR